LRIGDSSWYITDREAAIDLDVSPTAIGNAVSSLENRLGVRLFIRTTRNVALTSAGREYVEAIAPALSDIRNAARPSPITAVSRQARYGSVARSAGDASY
jgi:DNA-binding transcriptional LysR family regulator